MTKILFIIIGIIAGAFILWGVIFYASNVDVSQNQPQEVGNKNTQESNACKKTGCSQELCSDKDVTSACEYKPEYACYRDAVCERQPTGECEFTKTKDLQECLKK